MNMEAKTWGRKRCIDLHGENYKIHPKQYIHKHRLSLQTDTIWGLNSDKEFSDWWQMESLGVPTAQRRESLLLAPSVVHTELEREAWRSFAPVSVLLHWPRWRCVITAAGLGMRRRGASPDGETTSEKESSSQNYSSFQRHKHWSPVDLTHPVVKCSIANAWEFKMMYQRVWRLYL